MSTFDEALDQHLAQNPTHSVGGIIQLNPDGSDGSNMVRCRDCSWPDMGPVPEADPGPVPDDQPEVPPLTLKARIANAVDRWVDTNTTDNPADTLDDLIDIVHAEVSAGADYSDRLENTEMSPAQALAYILDLPEWARLNRLRSLLSQASRGTRCQSLMHEQIEAELTSANQAQGRYRAALERIARLTSTTDQPERAGDDVLGQIAAEALVPK
jgi:hypothetical protein